VPDPEPLVILENFEALAILQRILSAEFNGDSLMGVEKDEEGWKGAFNRMTDSAIQKFSSEAAAMSNPCWKRNRVATKRKTDFGQRMPKAKAKASNSGFRGETT
jgi:hypothetical protein